MSTSHLYETQWDVPLLWDADKCLCFNPQCDRDQHKVDENYFEQYVQVWNTRCRDWTNLPECPVPLWGFLHLSEQISLPPQLQRDQHRFSTPFPTHRSPSGPFAGLTRKLRAEKVTWRNKPSDQFDLRSQGVSFNDTRSYISGPWRRRYRVDVTQKYKLGLNVIRQRKGKKRGEGVADPSLHTAAHDKSLSVKSHDMN